MTQQPDGRTDILTRLRAAERNGINRELIQDAIHEIERQRAIVTGATEVSKGEYVIEYGWNSDENKMGYWCGTSGSFVSDCLTWAGTSRLDAWLVIGQNAEKARAT